MKNLKNLLAAGTLMAVIMLGVSSANAGLLVSDLGSTDQCSETATNNKKVASSDAGVLVQGFTGVLVQGLAGLLVSDLTGETPTDCGIIVHD